jgi:hypothetical protein
MEIYIEWRDAKIFDSRQQGQAHCAQTFQHDLSSAGTVKCKLEFGIRKSWHHPIKSSKLLTSSQ